MPFDGKSAAWASLCAALVLSWQALTVHASYGGNWTALFCTGAKYPPPPALAGENIYLFRHSDGWDGQFYHYVAHDPFLAHGIARYIDNPGLRYRRILVPALAYLLAWGRADRTDTAYRAVILLFFWLGAYWSGRLAVAHGHSRAWSLAFLALPAAISAMDRMAVDGALAALAVAFACYARDSDARWKLYIVLLAAPLVRDTGLLLVAAYCIWLLLGKRLLETAVFASAALPMFVWYGYVSSRTPPMVAGIPIVPPLSGMLDLLERTWHSPAPGIIDLAVKGFDYLLAAGILLALAVSFPVARKTGFNPLGWAIILFALLGVFMFRPGDWLDYGRVLSPLLIFLAVASRSRLALAPWCMVAPRCALQLAPQLLAVLGGVIPGVKALVQR